MSVVVSWRRVCPDLPRRVRGTAGRLEEWPWTPKTEQLLWGEAAVAERPCAPWALRWAGPQELLLHDVMHGLDK